MIVIDVSAAMEIARRTPKGNAFKMLMMEGEDTKAPNLFSYEAANAAWKMHAFQKNSQEQSEYLLDAMLAQVDEFVDADEYEQEAFLEACKYRHPAYDLFYAVLARRLGATLFTADKKLTELCIEMGVNVVEEIDFP